MTSTDPRIRIRSPRGAGALLLALALVPRAAVGDSASAASPGAAPSGALSPSAWQRALVEQLSGWTDGAQAPGFARSTPEERARAAALLEEVLAGLGLEPRRHEYRFPNVNGLVDLLLPPFRGVNVWAEIPATTPVAGELVVLGAHYDSDPGCPGAVDNASGVALVLAVAGELAALETRARPFRVVLFDQEEDDEVGSRAYAAALRREGVGVHSVHVVDLAGWDADGAGRMILQSAGPVLEDLYRERARRLGIPVRTTAGGSSDNRSFLAAGFTTAGVFDAEITPHLHRPGDTVATLHFATLAARTRLVADVMRELAAP